MLRHFLHLLESGQSTPRDLTALCLRRIAESDPEILAWAAVDPDPVIPAAGPLRGIPFGAKDIFDTVALPTQYGSPLYAGHHAPADATLIQNLRAAGAVLIGKTHTTAFASFDPAPTRNPRLPGHTPGGSSAGSAAAVAAGMAPFALGTQTLGSILRPASFCGVCGFKPTFRLLPMNGVLPFAPSLDTAGFFTGTAADMLCLWSRLFEPVGVVPATRLACFSPSSDDPAAGALRDATRRLRAAGFEIVDIGPPTGWPTLTAAAHTINCYEGARTHESRYRDFGEGMGVRLADLIRRGLAMPDDEHRAATAHVAHMRAQLAGFFSEYGAILSLAAAGPAPAGYAGTGDPSPNAPWTALGVPAVSVPLPVDAPVGLQITAASGRDAGLLTLAARIEEVLGGSSPK